MYTLWSHINDSDSAIPGFEPDAAQVVSDALLTLSSTFGHGIRTERQLWLNVGPTS